MLDWMYWTPQSVMIVLTLVCLIVLVNVVGLKYPNYFPSRKGFLRITTTGGERFFIALLFAVLFWLLWFKFFDLPLWISYLFVVPVGFVIIRWA